MSSQGPGVRFNGTLCRFEDVNNRHIVFLGVHKFIERMLMPEGLTLEDLHVLLGRRAPSRDRVDGVAFGKSVHDHVAHLISNKKWTAKEVNADWPDVRHVRALISLSNSLQLKAFKADAPVADRTKGRLFATALDALFQRQQRDSLRHVIAELKVFRTIAFADMVCEEFPTLRPPFDALPLTLGFLAEVQAALSQHMFNVSYPRRAQDSEALVFIVDRQTAKAHWREVSKAAHLTARCMLKLWDAGQAKEAAKRVQEIMSIAREAERTGMDYDEAKEQHGSGRLNLRANIRDRIAECVFENAEAQLLKCLGSQQIVDTIFSYI